MLGDQGVLLAQLAQAVIADIDAVQQDLPLLDVVEAGQQAGDGALAGTGTTHQRHRFARLHLEADVVQRRGVLGRIGEGDVAKLDLAAGALQGTGTGILLRLGVEQAEQAVAGGDGALELVVDVGQAFQRLEQHHHGGDHDGEGTGSQLAAHAVDGGHIEEGRQRDGGNHLHHRTADGIGGDHLHGLLAHVVADLEEALLLHLLATEHQHLFVPLEHLLGGGGDVTYRLLDVAADLAEATADKADDDAHHGPHHQEDHRQLPGVPEHQAEQADHGRPFPHQGDQSGTGGRGDLTGVVGHLGEQVTGVLAVEEAHRHRYHVIEHLLLQTHHHVIADPGHAVVGEEVGDAAQGHDAQYEEGHPLEHGRIVAVDPLVDQRLDGIDEGGIHGGVAQHADDAADQAKLAIPDITEQTLEDRPAVL